MFAEKNGGLDGAAAAQQASRRRHIWLCADDYGITSAVNTAIRDLMVRGRLNATSVMVSGPALHRSEAIPLNVLKSGKSRLAIGLHLTLTAPFRPLSENFGPLDDGAFPPLPQLLGEAFRRRLRPEALVAEVTSQLRAFFDTFGRAPDFIDGHHHVQLFPQISRAVLQVVKERAPDAWVRQCGRVVPLWERFRDHKGLLLDALSFGLRRRARALGLRTNPAFAGTYDFDAQPDFAALFPRFLDRLPAGSVVMCHPGFVDADLLRLDPLTSLREQEYAYFAGDDFPAVLADHGVTLG